MQTLTYQLNEQEVVAYFRFHFRTDMMIRKNVKFYWILFSCLCAAVAVCCFSFAYRILARFSLVSLSLWLYFALTITITIAYALFYPMYREWYYLRFVKRRIKSGEMSSLLLETTLYIEEDELVDRTPADGSSSSYHSLKNPIVQNHCIYILGSSSFFIIPFRAFESESARDAFLAHIAEKINTASVR